MAACGIGVKQLAVEIAPSPFALAERCPFAFAADLSQQPLLQNGIADTLAEFIKGHGLVSLEMRASETQSALIKKRNFGFVAALTVDIVGARHAENVASGCDLALPAGVDQKRCHILNESLAVAFALEEQHAQSMVRAQGCDWID